MMRRREDLSIIMLTSIASAAVRYVIFSHSVDISPAGDESVVLVRASEVTINWFVRSVTDLHTERAPRGRSLHADNV